MKTWNGGKPLEAVWFDEKNIYRVDVEEFYSISEADYEIIVLLDNLANAPIPTAIIETGNNFFFTSIIKNPP